MKEGDEGGQWRRVTVDGGGWKHARRLRGVGGCSAVYLQRGKTRKACMRRCRVRQCEWQIGSQSGGAEMRLLYGNWADAKIVCKSCQIDHTSTNTECEVYGS